MNQGLLERPKQAEPTELRSQHRSSGTLVMLGLQMSYSLNFWSNNISFPRLSIWKLASSLRSVCKPTKLLS